MNGPVVRSAEILAWMVLPVVGGYVLWGAALRRFEGGDALAGRLAKLSSRVAIGGVIPFMVVLVFWAAALPTGRTLALPVLGIAVHVLGGAAGWAFARASGYASAVRGACFLGGASSNVLTFGGIVAVLLLSTPADPHGERALAEMQLWRILEAPFYYLAAWPVAAVLAAPREGRTGWGAAFRKSFQPLTLLPIGGLALGVGLNAAGAARPAALEGLAGWLVRANIVLLGVTVGLTLRKAAVGQRLACCLGVAAVKFVLLPLVAVGAAWLLGFHGLTLQVIAVCASMPVAFMAVVGANLVGLDEEVLGSLWLFTTAAMVVVVPVLAFALPALARW
jgi:hypothetical protein